MTRARGGDVEKGDRPLCPGRPLSIKSIPSNWGQSSLSPFSTTSWGWLAIAPAFALLVYWRAPLCWFTNDDFAWLGLPLELNHARDLLPVLFAPKAQGTVRVFGDRLYFLTLGEIFGVSALPFHLVSLAFWCGDLILAALIGERLLRSRAAGVIAAVLWTSSSIPVRPVAWASGFNEVLCAFSILLAFYARLRGWRVTEWLAYLAGFGALEVIVMYPAIAALYAWCADRKQIRSTIPLFVPAMVFTVAHFALVHTTSPYYVLEFNRRMAGALVEYLKWSLGPSRIAQLTGHGGRIGTRVMWVVALALGIFAITRLTRREWIALFCCGWFLLLIAPVLPLAHHITDYYATIPELGLAWLAGWAIMAAWKSNWLLRVFAIALAAAFVTGSLVEVDAYTRWHNERSLRMRDLYWGVEDAIRAHPASAVILQNIDNDLFTAGLQDAPFRLFGVQKVYLAPGDDHAILAREDLGGLSPFLISFRQAFSMLDHGDARALRFEKGAVQDVTRSYQITLRADPRATRVASVDAGDPNAADLLGPTWYPAEGGFRWMPKSATVKLSGPRSASERLFITGYAPKAVVQSGPVTMTVSADGREIGKAAVRVPDARFAFDFALPGELVNRESIEITVSLDKVLRAPGDARDLGMTFGTFSIR